MARKYLLIIITPILLFCFSSCSEEKSEYHRNYLTEFELIISDSITIPYNRQLAFLDYSPERSSFLLADLSSSVTLLEINREGNVKNKFSCGGNGDDKIGITLAAAGYIDGDTIGLVSEKGIYLLSPEGETLEFYKSKVRFPDIVNYSFFSFKNKLNHTFIYSCDPFYDPTETLYMPGSPEENKKYYNAFKCLTRFDTKTKEKDVVIGFEKDGLFKKNMEKTYLNMYLAYYSSENKLYVLISPDPNIYVYDVTNNLQLVDQIPLNPDFYQTISSEANSKDMFRVLAVNSQFRNIIVSDEYTVVSYSRGIPEDMFPKSGIGLEELNELSTKFNRLYCMIYQDGKKNSEDVLVPKNVASIVEYIGNDQFIALPNPGRVEKTDKEMLYICTLKKI